ncbi:acyl-CoA carboxylase subunit epsilon [Catenuloplanes nepalensis]|uniref:acyl-CoA carboxylase subunit epsilon n=1 Tax=Catenuloplanes nepalensis TaxID=587533 RepID=UPI0027D7FCE3|nr:acyl-CoA carboxylase subunit epsilon [Catenuloplanes nepalensis]
MHSGARAPDLRILRGTPSPEELAALVGALRALTREAPSTAPSPRSAWAISARPAYAPAWRRSALPR